MAFRQLIRTFAVAGAICIGAALLGTLAGGVLSGQIGAATGLIAGAVFGLALGIRYSMDMVEIAVAQRAWHDVNSLQRLPQECRARQAQYTASPSRSYLRDKRGKIWTEVLAKRPQRLTQPPYSRFTSQRHHDLDLADIGITRKPKPKRK